MILTKEHIHSFKTPAGGYTNAFLMAIEEVYDIPPIKGWPDKLVLEYCDEETFDFLLAVSQTFVKKNGLRKSINKYNRKKRKIEEKKINR